MCVTEGDTWKLIQKYPRTANCNIDVWEMLLKFIQKRDVGFQAVQK